MSEFQNRDSSTQTLEGEDGIKQNYKITRQMPIPTSTPSPAGVHPDLFNDKTYPVTKRAIAGDERELRAAESAFWHLLDARDFMMSKREANNGHAKWHGTIMDTQNGTGWERHNRILFDGMVERYDKVRWGYPNELYADVLRYCGPGQGNKALEIGAGTGKATAPFLDLGYDVTAVELGKNMAAFLSEKFKTNKHFRVIPSAFEEVSLDDDHYDLIYAATSFHWVDAEAGGPKVFRLLKKGGVFALFRCNAVPAEGNEVYEEIQKVYEASYYRYYASKERPVRKSGEDLLRPAEIRKSFGFDGLEQFGFRDVTMRLYHASRIYSADEYIELLDTFSDHRNLPDELRSALYEGIREVIVRHGGFHEVDYLYQLYMGRKP